MRAASALLTLAFTAVVSAAPVSGPPASTLATYTHCNKPGVFALTFDDGPFESSWKLAKDLHAKGIKATFFTNGHNWFKTNFANTTTPTDEGIKTYNEVLANYDRLGHEVGSHTYEHLVLSSSLTNDQVEYQLNQQSDIIYNAIGKRPALFRPPEGELSDSAATIVHRLGYSNILWDVDTKDYENNGLQHEQDLVRAVVEKDIPGQTLGHISLQHDVHPHSVNELTPWLTGYLLGKNYTFVTVSECLGINGYQ